MKKVKEVIQKIVPFFKNFYFTTGFFMFVWVSIFDANDFFSQYRLTRKKNEIESEKKYFLEKIEQVKIEKEELFGNLTLVEKFARERYLMKKPTEDIYLLSKP